MDQRSLTPQPSNFVGQSGPDSITPAFVSPAASTTQLDAPLSYSSREASNTNLYGSFGTVDETQSFLRSGTRDHGITTKESGSKSRTSSATTVTVDEYFSGGSGLALVQSKISSGIKMTIKIDLFVHFYCRYFIYR